MLRYLGLAWRNWDDAWLVVQTRSGARELLKKLVTEPKLSGYKFIAVVSEDVPLEDDELLMWGLFTRFDGARDLIPARATFEEAWPRYEGPLGLDATWKTGYPKSLEMPTSVVNLVNKRWKEYGL